MAEFKRRDEPDSECDNCGSEAETVLTDWGPPFNAKHDRPKQALCEYCYNTTSMESQENRNRAQMMNVLERRLREFMEVTRKEAP